MKNPQTAAPAPFSSRMTVLGLTGGIACGKSTVSGFLKKLGAPIIDADAIAISLADINGPIYRAILEHFGKDIALNGDGTLNRAKVGEIVFRSEKERDWLNNVTHPLIKAAVENELAKCQKRGEKIVVLDVPLLFEVHWEKLCDVVWVVALSPAVQLQRLMARNSLTEDLARDRINSQMPLEEKCRLAHQVIDNSGTKEETYAIIENAWRKILER